MHICIQRPEPTSTTRRPSPARIDTYLEIDETALARHTLADLVAAGTGSAVDDQVRIAVDGQVIDASRPADRLGLLEGSLVEVDVPVEPAPPLVELLVVGGLHAGETRALTSGSHLIGRALFAEVTLEDPSVSRRHARLDIDAAGAASLVDLGSANGCRIDERGMFGPTPLAERFAVGATTLRLRRVGQQPADRSGRGGRTSGSSGARLTPTRPHNRPPRPSPAGAPPPIPLPAPPERPPEPFSLSWTMILLPVVLGGVLAAVFGPALALFTLLSPVLLLGQWLESRRRARRHRDRGGRAYADALERLADDLASARATEQTRRFLAHPDPAEIAERARLGQSTLWERRPDHDDFGACRLGLGEVRWSPSGTDRTMANDEAPEVRHLVAVAAVLAAAPVAIDLTGGWLGIVGDRHAALPVARWLVCQAVTLHGPADLWLAVVGDDQAAKEWWWTAWLPHAAPSPVGSTLATDDAAAERVAERLRPRERRAGAGADTEDSPQVLLLLDRDRSLATAGAAVRALTGEPTVSGIVLARDRRDLPARCRWVLELADTAGRAALHDLASPGPPLALVADGYQPAVAAHCARAIARFVDPFDRDATAALPSHVTLVDALGLRSPTADGIARRWSASDDATGMAACIGRSADGLVAVDLEVDGPHALIAGTTGSGKSELLRSLVASIAATHPPETVTFVLVDYKGGAAFDACARLPHTVGVVTDLDAQLGERALVSLEAELTFRERVLRDVGASDLGGYREQRRAGHGGPTLPRLVVVVDEFATLAAELPDFLDALVGIAQRGRSLGVHLVLATQRPSGVVNDNIRTNTNLRVALRVLDRADSADVLGSDEAVRIARTAPGRAIVRLGEGEHVAFQTAHVSGRTTAERSTSGIRPWRPWQRAPSPVEAAEADRHEEVDASPTDLDRLVDAAIAAHAARDGRPPRRPWTDPLPTRISLDELPTEVDEVDDRWSVPLALADEPAEQRRTTWRWRPRAGNLLVVGMPGSGTTTALATVATSLVVAPEASRLHLFVVDFGAGDLHPLLGLPQTAAYVGAHETERLQRLLRFLAETVDERRATDVPTDLPAVVVLIDGFAAMRSAFDDLRRAPQLDQLLNAFRDGPAVGVHLAISADRANALPPALTTLTEQRIALRLPDVYDYASLGLRVSALPDGPGRGFVPSGHEVQVAAPTSGLDEQIERLAPNVEPPRWPPPRIEVLPASVTRAELTHHAWPTHPGCLVLPVGLRDRDLAPEALVLHPHEHALVAGDGRTGRTTALRSLAAAASERGVPVVWFDDAMTELPATIGDAVLVVVDDADRIGEHALLEQLIGAGSPEVHLVAAVHASRFRTAYGHWAHRLRASRTGLALGAGDDLDGDLWSVRLPTPPGPSAAHEPGRGVLINAGSCQVVQVAVP